MLLKARKPSSLKVSFEEVMDMALKDINQDQVIPFGMGNAGGINYCFNDKWMADNYYNQQSFGKSIVNLFQSILQAVWNSISLYFIVS